MARDATKRVLELVEDGLLDKDYLLRACLDYLSEDDVKGMCQANDIPLFEIEDDEDE